MRLQHNCIVAKKAYMEEHGRLDEEIKHLVTAIKSQKDKQKRFRAKTEHTIQEV